jgi:DNA-binding response OmpR family regulator
VIDDEVAVLDATALGLREAGYEVLTAPGAAAGLDVVDRSQIDAIVTDMNMPGTSGVELIAEARAAWPDLPIVAITGASVIGGMSAADAAEIMGADTLLTKPFRARELDEVLQHLMLVRGRRPSAAPVTA